LSAVSPNLYATAFGLAGLAGAWRLANQFYGTPGWIEDALYLVATAIYPLLVATFAAKLIDQPKAGAMFLGFVMLVMITVLMGGIALWSLVALRQGVPALAQRGGLPQVIHCMRWPCSATRCAAACASSKLRNVAPLGTIPDTTAIVSSFLTPTRWVCAGAYE
jgi:hypothetical protein